MGRFYKSKSILSSPCIIGIIVIIISIIIIIIIIIIFSRIHLFIIAPLYLHPM